MICSSCGKRLESDKSSKRLNSQLNRSVSWSGISIGFLFLITTLSFGIVEIFGSSAPQNTKDIPMNILVNFGILATFLLVMSGLISSYIGGSLKLKNGIINGGLVGVILGLIVGAVTGNVTFILALAIFRSLTCLGGVFGTFLKRRFNKYL